MENDGDKFALRDPSPSLTLRRAAQFNKMYSPESTNKNWDKLKKKNGIKLKFYWKFVEPNSIKSK